MRILSFIWLFCVLDSCISQEVKVIDSVDQKSQMQGNSKSKIDSSDLIVLLNCRDSTFLDAYPFTEPDSCKTLFEQSKGKIDNKSRGINLRQCKINHLSNPKNGYKCDTIYVSNIDILTWIPNITTWEDQFFKTKNDVYDNTGALYHSTEYYTIEEMNGTCVTGFFRVKSKEFWKDGKRNGICQYFHENGELKQTIEYNMGRVVREEVH